MSSDPTSTLKSISMIELIVQKGSLVPADGRAQEALLTSHQALKRLQYESGVECDQMEMRVPNVGMVEVRVPKSIAFDKMDETAFRAMTSALCSYIAETYWPDCTEEQIEQMAGAMVD